MSFIREEFGRAVDSVVFQKMSVSFFCGGRETLTVNLSGDGLRVYIHPDTGARGYMRWSPPALE